VTDERRFSVLGLAGSPRTDGNSRALLEALIGGAADAGHATELVQLDDVMSGFLRDCRRCRDEAGMCTIADGYAALLTGPVLDADAIVLATPLYWYGVSGILKTFLDRIFCFIAASHPANEDVRRRLAGKRLVVLMSAEESYEGATLGVRASMQELARYLHWELVGFLVGVGNRRGEVDRDPASPLAAAAEIGRTLPQRSRTDYRLDTPRPGSVWGAA
jgi:multimeric flavodoxin WrbA